MGLNIKMNKKVKHKTGLASKIHPQYTTEKQYIYILLDPRTDLPIYVGRAICPISRLGLHLSTKSNFNKRFQVYLEELRALFLVPKLQILEIVTLDNVMEREKFWISHYCDVYPTIFNKAYRPKTK